MGSWVDGDADDTDVTTEVVCASVIKEQPLNHGTCALEPLFAAFSLLHAPDING